MCGCFSLNFIAGCVRYALAIHSGFTFRILYSIMFLHCKTARKVRYMGYVFISYSTKNQASADGLNSFLNENGIDTWMAPYDIPVGFKYAQVITEAIQDCDCLVLLLTEAAQRSNWIPREIERAVNYGKRILPIMLEPVELTGDFQLYISVNHSIIVGKIDPASAEMQKIVSSIRLQDRAPRADTYRVGNIVDGKYEIIELIDQGDDFDVFISQDKMSRKYLARAMYQQGKSNSFALAVANLNKQLCHPMLPNIVDIVYNDDHILAVSDYTKGMPLSSLLQEQGAQSEETVLQWAKQLADCLNYLHSQKTPVFHINLQPNQLMLSQEGTLLIRNIVMPADTNAPVYPKNSVFAAPECQNGTVDARSNIYAFGYLLYSLITGKDFSKPPYVMLPIRANNPRLSAAMERIVLKCIEPNPNDRYQTIAQLEKDLQSIDKINRKSSSSSAFKRLFSGFKKTRQ